MGSDSGPQLAILHLALVPASPCAFRASPAHSLRAALLRRLELFDPDLAHSMHDAPDGASSVERPWTISSLLGPLERQGDTLTAQPGETCRVRLAGLTERVLQALQSALVSDHPIAREPLVLEQAPFRVIAEDSQWREPATYASLLSRARPHSRITIELRSPTGFKRGGERTASVPGPRLCLQGYLRKWNAFSDVLLPEEPLLEFAAANMAVASQSLRGTFLRLGTSTVPGVLGRVEWQASDTSNPYLLRLVNALVDYAFYCGTGVQTTQGMGQTVRIRSGIVRSRGPYQDQPPQGRPGQD